MSAPKVDRSLETCAARFAAVCLEITALRRAARALSCEVAEDGDAETNTPHTPDCLDNFNSVHADTFDDESPRKWWQATEEERQEFCSACREKAALYAARHSLRLRAGALKRSLLAAYQRAVRENPMAQEGAAL